MEARSWTADKTEVGLCGREFIAALRTGGMAARKKKGGSKRQCLGIRTRLLGEAPGACGRRLDLFRDHARKRLCPATAPTTLGGAFISEFGKVSA